MTRCSKYGAEQVGEVEGDESEENNQEDFCRRDGGEKTKRST